MEKIEYFGLFAAFCTTIAFVPQVYKTWKTKSTKYLSKLTFLTFFLGVFCWLIYGIIISDFPIIIANSVTLILSMLIIIVMFKYK